MFMIYSLWLRVQGVGFWDLVFRVLGFTAQVFCKDFGFQVSGFGFRVSGFRFQASGFGSRF